MISTDLLTPGQGRAVAELLDAVAEHDGVAPVDEAGRLQLRDTRRRRGVLHLLVYATDRSLAAYAGVLPDGTAQGAVRPDQRRRGHGAALLRTVLERRPEARVWAHGALDGALALLSGAGLAPVRTLLTMRRTLEDDIAQGAGAPEDVELTTFEPRHDADAWVAVNARAFAAHPEQGRLSRRDLEARMAEPWFDPRGFHVARRGDELLAFVWTKRETGSDVGEIYVVGTAPEAQGLGLASTLMARAMAHLRDEGVRTLELYVEGDNEHARRLYERLGFTVAARDVQFAAEGGAEDAGAGGAEAAVSATRPIPLVIPPQQAAPEGAGRPEGARSSRARDTGLTRGDSARERPLAEELPADRFLERELSWLAFNERVQELSADPMTPLLERVRFSAIFSSNLDEFFMVRVAGLKRRLETGLAVTGPSGISPRQVLELVRRRAHELQVRQARIVEDELRPALEEVAGVRLVHWGELDADEQAQLTDFFVADVFPVLTPLAVDPAHPFPYISGLALNLAIQMRPEGAGDDGKIRFARVKVPDALSRFVQVRSGDGSETAEDAQVRFIGLEDVIAANLDQLFPGMEIVDHHLFRVTRNEDLEVEEDDAENLLHALEKELLRRRFGAPVRLELEEDIEPEVRDWLVRELGVAGAEVFELPGLLDLRGLTEVADLDAPILHYPAFVPATNLQLKEVESASQPDVFAAIRKRDILLHHPYDSFSTSVQAFLEQAAADPQVLAIKQTLYRTSGDSPIVDALIDAAEAGKQVLALVEIKARFDEQNNISWARKLEHAGVHVVYGIVGLKTHCKLSMVVRQEEGGLRRYCHVGTGNYHPKTARLYEDLGLLTCDEQVGADLTRLFNQLSGYAPRTTFGRLLVAPRSVRSGLVELIEQEIEHHQAGRPARVRLKCNSMVDEQLIDALYRASRAGVPVDIVVRGICALRPGVPDLSENIRVRSVLGRFLEHSRIFAFEGGGAPVVMIGSADLMHRNLDRRVEALVELAAPDQIEYLRGLMDLEMDDATQSWHLDAEGRWTRHGVDASGEALRDVQAELIASRRRRRRLA
ncbi:RNA degradosome polyphosphate kinase [Brachybacterium huguangmaarense]|uniref:Multifunctional fusion protein n=1 Tax=Brachybacterium huguangmaarense TaxID=1652028 RepID=A0ABY6G5S0_9MICO|nr:RNA degradosome polyphosphate kinase [Brachybacterium huguangmaarense]UYG18001.1 RNA degradosome polyphosphate kinase [Brachybacterium huguangmaarense]